MSTLFLVPARGGSKGIPGKNIALLSGKPLISYTIDAFLALDGEFGSDICVSTDSKDVAEVVEKAGVPVPFLRPEEISTDTASAESVMLHALAWYRDAGKQFDTLVLLQPTSPLRTALHIREAIALYRANAGVDMVVSVREAKSNPYFNLFEEDGQGFLARSKKSTFARRQDCPNVYEYNGAIYVINVASLLQKGFLSLNKIKKYVMNAASSADIDSPEDLQLCEYRLSQTNNHS